MDEKWILAEGIEKLFSVNSEGRTEISDLVTFNQQITLDISFVEIEAEEIDGMKVEPTKGINVILTRENPLFEGDEGDDDLWMFSRNIFPMKGETLPELVKRVAIGLGVKPDERVWENGDG